MKKLKLTGGTKKGISISVPPDIRPTTGIVKRSLFDTLSRWIEGKYILELFAGSGAIGFEAISRGAEFCIFVELKKEKVRYIRDNIEKLGFTGKCSILNRDAISAIRLLIKKKMSFDFIFADPPYRYRNFDSILENIPYVLKKDGRFVIESHYSKKLPQVGLFLEKEVYIGETKLSYYRNISG